MSELDRHDDELIEPEIEDYSDPLDALPAPLREPAKAYRAVALIYLLVHNADRVSALLRAAATNLEQLLSEAEAIERRDAAAPD